MVNFRSLQEEAYLWASRKNGWIRLPLLFWGIYVMWRILTVQNSFTPFDWLNLGIHELGHLIFMPFGEFIGVLGGSFAQIAVPIASVFMFIKQKDYFGASFCFCWLAESLLNLSFYIADANTMGLLLFAPFGGGGEVIHDWNYILSYFELLHRDKAYGSFTRLIALASNIFFLFTGGLLFWKMQQGSKGVKGVSK